MLVSAQMSELIPDYVALREELLTVRYLFAGFGASEATIFSKRGSPRSASQ
jgi:hypothetical protein